MIDDMGTKHAAPTMAHDESYDTALAIIGMSGRFPGARDVEAFWQNIAAGVKSIRHFSDEELLAAGVDPQLLAQPNYVKAGTVLEDIDRFDASFFKFSPREAEILDPQHRMFLECAYEALENAGYDCETYEGLIGVFAGSAFSTYLLNNIFANPEVMDLIGNIQASIGNDRDSLASTVSYKLNLRGPSFAVQTFCSTSLVAVHLACQSLLNYECDMALAGGVAIQLPQVSGYLYEEGGIVSPDGECRTFDARGQGSVMGNGAGVVVLKRLEEAIEDGDYIYAVIRGSAINNDGSVRVSYTAPGLGGQTEVMVQAISNAGVPVESINYIEAHGTATMLGDAVELAAMQKAFGMSTQKKGFCAIGSVKPNIGHLDRASGVTGLIKATLALHHQLIPPSLNFERTNPDIDLENSPFYVNTKLAAWPANGTPRRAGVSSFGLGGTNAHVVLEEAPPLEPADPSRPWQLLVLSAKTETALKTAAKNLAAHLKSHADLSLADAAYTLQVGRSAFNYRQIVVCRDRMDAIAALETTDSERIHTLYQDHRDRQVVFLFPGSGTQYAGMTQELYSHEATFRDAVDRCSELLQPLLGLDLRDAIYSERHHTESIEQAAVFVIEYSLAQLLIQWGIGPQAIVGYALGEVVAACLADVISLEDALLLIARRTQLTQALPAGAVLAEALNEVVRQVKLHKPEIPYFSNITGTWITPEHATNPAYWAELMRQTEHSADSIGQLLQQDKRVLVEVGIGQSLSSHIQQQLACNSGEGEVAPTVISLLPSLDEQHSEQATLLTALGKLWLAGVSIDWKGLVVGERRRRLPLPTYPFEKQRYWIDEPGTKPLQENSLHVDAGKKPDIADWFYAPCWEKSALPTQIEAKTRQASLVLIFMDSTGLGEQIAQRLTHQNHEVVRVFEGTNFTRVDERTYSIRADQPGDYSQLIAELVASKLIPVTILHCWSLSHEDESTPSTGDRSTYFDTRQDKGFYSLIYLAQALEAQLFDDRIQLVVISNQLHSITGQEVLCPEKSTILGACKVIPQENLNIFCRAIDLEIPASGTWADAPILDQLTTECLSEVSDLAVAYRDTTRWVQTFEATRLEPVAVSSMDEDRLVPKGGDKPSPLLRAHGVYLITGAFGGVGPVLAEYLAKSVQARLVLVGRSAFPAKEEWHNWLKNHADNDAISRKIRHLQEIEAAGAELLLLQADVADLFQMQRVIQQTLQRFGAINGVIHAAGITVESAFRPLQTLGKAECELHFRPKVHGVFALEQALQGVDLDFCLLFSSISAVLGGSGFAGYAAANLFMDAFVQQHNRLARTP
ncbi:MAG TPA: type I polyketide synthase, partial [Ktedonobacteraceae bacterium]|nr:type I polyketide synthase [Ktedonobacteraceae bacterium]